MMGCPVAAEAPDPARGSRPLRWPTGNGLASRVARRSFTPASTMQNRAVCSALLDVNDAFLFLLGRKVDGLPRHGP